MSGAFFNGWKIKRTVFVASTARNSKFSIAERSSVGTVTPLCHLVAVALPYPLEWGQQSRVGAAETVRPAIQLAQVGARPASWPESRPSPQTLPADPPRSSLRLQAPRVAGREGAVQLVSPLTGQSRLVTARVGPVTHSHFPTTAGGGGGGPSGDQLAEGQVSKPTPVPPGEKGHRFLPGRRRRCGTVTCLQPLPQEAQQGVSAHTFLSLEVSVGPRDGVPRPRRPLRACSPTPFPATPEASGAFCAAFPVATPHASFRLALRWELSAPLASALRRPPVPCASPSPLVATPGLPH